MEPCEDMLSRFAEKLRQILATSHVTEVLVLRRTLSVHLLPGKIPLNFLILLVKVATTFPRGFPGGFCWGSLHQLQVKLREPLAGRTLRASLHEVWVKLRAPLTGFRVGEVYTSCG